jgi:hypothetical protein
MSLLRIDARNESWRDALRNQGYGASLATIMYFDAFMSDQIRPGLEIVYVQDAPVEISLVLGEKASSSLPRLLKGYEKLHRALRCGDNSSAVARVFGYEEQLAGFDYLVRSANVCQVVPEDVGLGRKVMEILSGDKLQSVLYLGRALRHEVKVRDMPPMPIQMPGRLRLTGNSVSDSLAVGGYVRSARRALEAEDKKRNS